MDKRLNIIAKIIMILVVIVFIIIFIITSQTEDKKIFLQDEHYYNPDNIGFRSNVMQLNDEFEFFDFQDNAKTIQCGIAI